MQRSTQYLEFALNSFTIILLIFCTVLFANSESSKLNEHDMILLESDNSITDSNTIDEDVTNEEHIKESESNIIDEDVSNEEHTIEIEQIDMPVNFSNGCVFNTISFENMIHRFTICDIEYEVVIPYGVTYDWVYLQWPDGSISAIHRDEYFA